MIWAWFAGKLRAVWPWLLLIGAALLAALGALRRAERAGAEAERLRQQERIYDVQSKWDAINARPRDFDASVDRLRERARRAGVSRPE